MIGLTITFPMQRLISIILIVIFVLFFNKEAFSQCVGSGLTSGKTFANNTSYGTLAFSSPSNAKNNDGSYATATATAVLISLQNTNYLTATNFGFTLPATALVCGIEASVVKKASGLNIVTYVSDNSVMLLKNGVLTGSNYASSTHWGTSNTTASYGSPTDSWGSTWTYSDINSSNFGVAFSANVYGLLGLATSANVDQIQLNVFYDVTPLAVQLESFTAIKNNEASFLSWVVNAENDFSNFIAQRSTDLNSWENIAEIKAQKSQQQYLFDDEKPQAGNNYYRIEMIDINGNISYSGISMVSEQLNQTLRLYPNPASDYLNITAKNSAHLILIRDEYGRVVKSINISLPTDNIKISITELKHGAYFVQIDESTLKLWKK